MRLAPPTASDADAATAGTLGSVRNWCPGRESNRYGRYRPREFRTTSAFAATHLLRIRGLDFLFAIYCIHEQFSGRGRQVSTLSRADSMRLRKYSIEQLRAAVADSRSMRQVLSRLNVVPAGGNYDVLRKAIRHWQLDTSHFTGQAWNRRRVTGPKHPIDVYLSNEKPIQSSRLAKRLLAEQILPRRCYSCNRTRWLDGAIPLELHHVNGDRSSNQLSNLRLLCPNCHALTPTYRGKNRTKA